jgi:transposase-like protein
MDDPRDISRPICSACGKAMALTNTIPKVASVPELRTYRCHLCGSVTTKEIESPAEQDRPSRRGDVG